MEVMNDKQGQCEWNITHTHAKEGGDGFKGLFYKIFIFLIVCTNGCPTKIVTNFKLMLRLHLFDKTHVTWQ